MHRPVKRKREAERGELLYKPPRRMSPVYLLRSPGSLSPPPRFIRTIKTVKYPPTTREEREMAPKSVKSYRANNQKVIVNPITLNPTLQKCSGVFLKPSPAAAMNLRVICTAPVNETIFTFQ